MTDFNPLDFVLRLTVFALAISVHECAHGWMANRKGDPTARDAGRLTLNPIAHIDPVGTVIVPIVLALTTRFVFGWAKPVPINSYFFRDPKRDVIWVSLAGPFSNIVFAVVFGILGWVASLVGLYALFTLLYYGVLINLVLAFFNLLPIPPLDGSHVLEAYLPWPHSETYRNIRPYGFLILVLLIFSGLLRIYLGVTAAPLADLLTKGWF